MYLLMANRFLIKMEFILITTKEESYYPEKKFGNKQNLEVVGFFAVKTLNSYITDDTEEDVILNKDFIIVSS